jgi:hypothetical protein
LICRAARIVAANLHGESIVETKARAQRQPEMLIRILYALIHRSLIAARLLLEDGAQRGARVFRINVDATGQHSLMADIRPRKIKAALHFQAGVRFNLLRHKFAQDRATR